MSWNAGDAATLYVTWSQGFRAGGFNRGFPISFNSPLYPGDATNQAQAAAHGGWALPLAYAPDNLTNTEVGWRTNWLGGRLQWNGTVYQEDWTHAQVITAGAILGAAGAVVNGGTYQGKRYLSKKTVQLMLSNHIVGMGGTTIATTGPGYGFGLGFAVRLDEGMGWAPGSKGDAMWAGAWGTSFWIDPKEGLVGILMSQAPSTRIYSRMLYKDLVYGAVVK